MFAKKTKEQMLKKMAAKAALVHDRDIDLTEEDFTDFPLEDFYELNLKLYFHPEKNAFYKEGKGTFYRYIQAGRAQSDDKLAIRSIEERLSVFRFTVF